MNYHWQNLKKEDNTNHLFHGRNWFRFGENTLSSEWAIPSKDIRIMLSLNSYGDDAIAVSISLFLFSIHLALENNWLYKHLSKITKRSDNGYTSGRNIGFYLYGDAFSVSIWNDPMESRNTDYWFQHIYINLTDFFLGRSKCTTKVLEERDILIPMPEKSYPATGQLVLYSWSRPRWFTKKLKRVSIECKEGVSHPGKGTASYNCGEDATFSLTTGECNSIEKGIGIFVGSVLRDRKVYPL